MAEVVIMPKLGFDMAEGILIRWVKEEGEQIAQGEVLAEIETDKATVEVESSATGVILKQLITESTHVPVGSPIAVIGEADEDIDLEALIASVEATPTPALPQPMMTHEPPSIPEVDERPMDEPSPARVPASPVARRLAQEHGLDLGALTGSGPGGRIVKKDVLDQMQAPAISATAVPLKTERLPLSRLRAAIGRRMSSAKQQLPHFYVTADINAGPMMDIRSQYNALHPEDPKVSVNDFIVKSSALALRNFPNLNASLDGEAILRHGEINIGVAVAVNEGLLTVVVRKADTLSIREISRATREMAARAREGRVRPSDIEGSTFTVSNLGMFDVDSFVAIINPPEAAILAVGSVREVPVVKAGTLEPGRRLKVTLSADHRVTDGAEAARWLQSFRQVIEQPLQLLAD